MTSISFKPADEPGEESRKAGERLFRGKCEFMRGVVALDGLPPPDRQEICFAGRSNAGKSSLINALAGRKSLARTSNTPGRTQELNYFELGDTHYMVDLPGYGFARAPLEKVRKWQSLLKAYMSGRPNLRRVFILIDARRGPREADGEIMRLLDSAAVSFQAVLTKCDKTGARELEAARRALAEALHAHPVAMPEYVVTSSAKNMGLDTLRAIIADIV